MTYPCGAMDGITDNLRSKLWDDRPFGPATTKDNRPLQAVVLGRGFAFPGQVVAIVSARGDTDSIAANTVPVLYLQQVFLALLAVL